MEILQSIFSNTIIAFIILIGVVVFVHELGHFLAGKAFGIGVEEFSIGFGPKAFSIRKGNTDYRINWLPLGGYVRFYGADLEETVPLEMREKSILHAKVHKRAIVSFAGPLANFILSFFVMTILSIYGLPNQPAIVSVLPNSVAEKSGIKSGDKILSIDDEKIKGWSDLSSKINRSPDKNLTFLLESSGTKKVIKITPAKEEVETPLGNTQTSGRIGVSGFFNSSHIFVPQNSFLQTIGLQTGDKITSINGKKVEYFYQVLNYLEDVTQSKSDFSLAHKINNGILDKQEINLLVERNNKDQKNIIIKLASSNIKAWANTYLIQNSSPKIEWDKDLLSSDQTISAFQNLVKGDKLIPAQDAWKSCGMKEGDTIYSIAGVGRIFSLLQFYSWMDSTPKSLSNDAKKLGNMKISMQVISANGVLKQLNCQIPLRNGFDHLNREQIFLDFPIQFISQNIAMPPEIVKAASFADAINKGFTSLLNQIYLTYNAIKMLFTGSIPLSNLGGPIAIASVAGEAAKGGIMVFLMTMAFISTNVGMMNLLPLPALDGGTLFLQAVEAAYGKALPKSVQLTVQRIGIFILLGLFVIVFYNDILRLIRF
jgi:regulator of sigma E protease